MSDQKDTIPYGYCHCGCGRRPNISNRSNAKTGHVKGVPFLYIAGHNSRSSRPEYVAEDRGYKTPCHIWNRSLNTMGYGKAYRDGKRTLAHRLYFEEKYGEIPEGLILDHLCRQTACVNPDHLEIVTHTENVRRGNAAKITSEIAATIRGMRGVIKQKDVAVIYGISWKQVGSIMRGEYWSE